jgi:uncharacterized protein YxjI
VSDLLNRNVLVISQKPKFVEMTNEYEITDESGGVLGVIRQEGQSKARKLLRLVTSVDQFLTHKLAVYDTQGVKVLELVRPAKVFKSTLEVVDGKGARVGKIVQENVVGKKRFRLEGPTEELLGSIDAENWRSWDFAIHDQAGTEVGRITKKWAGILREGFTTADRYLLSVSAEVAGDLRTSTSSCCRLGPSSSRPDGFGTSSPTSPLHRALAPAAKGDRRRSPR